MPITDLTDDPRVEMQIASNIGAGIRGIVNRHQQKRKLAEERERRQLQHAYTIKTLNSGLQGQDLLNAFNEMPGAIDNELVQKMNSQALENRITSPTSLSHDFQAFNRLVDSRQKLYKWDGVQQQFVLQPGGEELVKGYDTGIKNILQKINASLPQEQQIEIQQQATIDAQPAAEDIEPTQPVTPLSDRLERTKQTQRRTLIDRTISDEAAMQSIRDTADSLTRAGIPRQEAKNRALEQYQQLLDEDKGKHMRRFPRINFDDVFDDVEVETGTAVQVQPAKRPTRPGQSLSQEEIDSLKLKPEDLADMTAEQLRRVNTREAYEAGKKKGFWK